LKLLHVVRNGRGLGNTGFPLARNFGSLYTRRSAARPCYRCGRCDERQAPKPLRRTCQAPDATRDFACKSAGRVATQAERMDPVLRMVSDGKEVNHTMDITTDRALVPMADEGQRIRVSGNRVVAMQVVETACANKDGGHWFCGVHDEHFPNNMSWWSHVDADPRKHLAVWMCHEHGPEVP